LGHELLSGGAVGWVYKIDDRIVLKYSTNPDNENFRNEIEFFDILDRHEPCPDIIQSFLRTRQGNFLAFMVGGSLDERLLARQRRSNNGISGKIIEISGTEPVHLVER
jgi:atypical protein kinase C zeta type